MVINWGGKEIDSDGNIVTEPQAMPEPQVQYQVEPQAAPEPPVQFQMEAEPEPEAPKEEKVKLPVAPKEEKIKAPKPPKEKKPGKKKRVLLIILAVLVAIVLGAVVAWRVLDAMGKKELYGDGTEAPALAGENDENLAGQTDAGEEWQDGWVSYNGKTYEYNKNILTFLFLGIDDLNYATKKTGYRNGGQADAIFLLVINPDTKEISVIAVNRNTITGFDMYDADGNFEDRGYGQICLAYEFGDGRESSCENELKTVKDLFYNLPINGYVAINMGAISTINDAIGAVTVKNMSLKDGKIVYGDDVTLKGEDAYHFVHDRSLAKEDIGAAEFRLEKQKVYIKALLEKTLSQVKKNPAILANIYQAIEPYMTTDVSLAEVTYLAGNMAGYHFNPDIYSLDGNLTVSADGYEEFNYDQEALYDLMIKVFYKEVE